MKKQMKKLVLSKETVRNLDGTRLQAVGAGDLYSAQCPTVKGCVSVSCITACNQNSVQYACPPPVSD